MQCRALFRRHNAATWQRSLPAHGPAPRVRLLAWSIFACALLLWGLAFALQPAAPDRQALVQAGLLWALTALAWRFPVQFGPHSRIYTTSAATFAGALLLPPWLAMAVAALGVAAGEYLAPGPLERRLFNIAALSLNVLAAAAIIDRLSDRALLTRTGPRDLAAILLAAGAHYTINAVLVEGIGALQRRPSLAAVVERHRRFLPQRVALYVLGVFGAMVGNAQPLALLLGAIPGFAIYRSLRDGAALRSQTRAAIEELADIVDMRDRYTYEHSRRVAELARLFAERLRLPQDQTAIIVAAARVHDIGKIGIRSTTLFKPAVMDEEETLEMRSHPEIGARLVSRFPDFAAGAEIVLHHHERWDGKGYPGSLAGTRIPFGARLVAIVDTFDAMTSTRAYRRALPPDTVLAELRRGRGTQFDPELLDAFLAMLDEQPKILLNTESGVLSQQQSSAGFTPGFNASADDHPAFSDASRRLGYATHDAPAPPPRH